MISSVPRHSGLRWAFHRRRLGCRSHFSRLLKNGVLLYGSHPVSCFRYKSGMRREFFAPAMALTASFSGDIAVCGHTAGLAGVKPVRVCLADRESTSPCESNCRRRGRTAPARACVRRQDSGFCGSARCLGPAEDLFNALADLLRGSVREGQQDVQCLLAALWAGCGTVPCSRSPLTLSAAPRRTSA